MSIKEYSKTLLTKLPFVKNLVAENSVLHKETQEFYRNCAFPPGHFYSVLVSVDEIDKRQDAIWSEYETDKIAGIDLQAENQKRLIEDLSCYYGDMPFGQEKQGEMRFYFNNDYFSYTDGIILYSMIRHFQPRRIIEVGSGFSSALMMDTNDLFMNSKTDLTFVEPHPERLYSLLKEDDREKTTIIGSAVQSVNVDEFRKLAPGDFLFIDGTHVVKTGNDVNYLLFQVLPALEPGVLIHFHDIYYPFEYPKNWVMEGRNWNEAYFLRAFLMYNSGFVVKLFNQFLHRFHSDVFSHMPLCYSNWGSSLWIMKK